YISLQSYRFLTRIPNIKSITSHTVLPVLSQSLSEIPGVSGDTSRRDTTKMYSFRWSDDARADTHCLRSRCCPGSRTGPCLAGLTCASVSARKPRLCTAPQGPARGCVPFAACGAAVNVVITVHDKNWNRR